VAGPRLDRSMADQGGGINKSEEWEREGKDQSNHGDGGNGVTCRTKGCSRGQAQSAWGLGLPVGMKPPGRGVTTDTFMP
jgi:hypothetical protein